MKKEQKLTGTLSPVLVLLFWKLTRLFREYYHFQFHYGKCQCLNILKLDIIAAITEHVSLALQKI